MHLSAFKTGSYDARLDIRRPSHRQSWLAAAPAVRANLTLCAGVSDDVSYLHSRGAMCGMGSARAGRTSSGNLVMLNWCQGGVEAGEARRDVSDYLCMDACGEGGTCVFQAAVRGASETKGPG